MNKVKLIEAIASKLKITKKEVESMLNAFEEIVTKTLKDNERVVLTGFGQFEVKTSKPREGVNPRNTSERIQIPEVKTPKFRAGKTLKDAIRK